MKKQNVTLTINENVWANFKKLMIDRKKKASRVISDYMEKEVDENEFLFR